MWGLGSQEGRESSSEDRSQVTGGGRPREDLWVGGPEGTLEEQETRLAYGMLCDPSVGPPTSQSTLFRYFLQE